MDGADLAENLTPSSSSGSIKTDLGSPVNLEGRRQYDRDLLLQLRYSKHSKEKPDTLQHFPDIIPDEFIDSIQEEEEPVTVQNVRVNDAGPLPGNIASPEGNQTLRATIQAEPNILAAAPLPWCDLDAEKVTQILSRLRNPEGGAVEILMVIPPLNSSGEERTKEEVLKSSGEETTKEEVLKSSGEETTKKKQLVKGAVKQGMTNDGKNYEIKEQKKEMKRKTLTLSQDERELYRKVRSILNKLTPQKFQTLIKLVQGLVIDTETKLKGVTKLIWEQATTDTAYAKEYASLCTHLMQVEVPFEQIEGEHLRFRTALLILCRKGFTEIMNYAQNINEEKDSSEEWHDNTKYRRKYVGFVRFMGELFQHEMLIEKIIMDCLSKLLQPRNEILLECFCQLMFVVGETLHHRNKADDYFQQIQEIIGEKNVSTKCCFLLQDVIDLRINEWKPLRHQYTPVTIDEIHEQVNLEEVRQMKWEVNQVPMWRPVIVIEPPPTRVPLSGQPCPLPDSSTFARDLTKLQNHDCRIYESPTAWSRGTPRLEFGEPEEELYPKVRGILNKLTPQKFQTLIKQFQGLVIDTETKLKGVTDIIFEKAISEPAFSEAYANMCRYLLTLKVPSDKKPGESINFRVIMLTRCQREFEKENDTQLDIDRRKKDIEEATDQKKATEMKGEIDQAITNARRRSLGNIRFIGELFKLKMLTETIMHDCVYKLLRSRDGDSLECACRLLTSIGKELESEKAKPRMNQYFEFMKEIVAEKKVSSRCRFKLQDVIDLRDNSWKPHREENNPKTIHQIHKDAMREAVEQNMPTALRMAQRRSQKMRHQSRIAQDRPSGITKGSIEYVEAIRDWTIDIKNADKNIEFNFRGGFGGGSTGDGSRAFQEDLMSKAPGRRNLMSGDRTTLPTSTTSPEVRKKPGK